MSKENAKQFLSEYKNNKEATDLLKEYPKAKTADEFIRQIADVAGKLGVQITAEEMLEAANELKKEREAQTDASVKKVQKLNDTDLENVDGGFYYLKSDSTETTYLKDSKVYNACRNDFEDTDCWINDACNASVEYYYGCTGEMFADGAENDCTADFYCNHVLK
jgi:hypothetical protein